MKLKRMITLVLSLMVILSCMPTVAFAGNSDNIASGTSGTCSWTIDANGVLTISQGTLEEWYDSPWDDYRDAIKSVKTTGKVKLKTGYDMFSGCTNLTDIDTSGFDTSSVTDMEGMFIGCISLETLDLKSFDTSNVTRMHYMFEDCQNLKNLDLTSFDTSNVQYMHHMFYGCSKLTSLDLTGFNTSNVQTMDYMFADCSSLQSIDLSRFNTATVTNMMMMFSSCESLKSLNLKNFITSKVTNMYGMFYGCRSLTDLNVTSFNTAIVTDMRRMFEFCTKLSVLDLSSFNTSKAKQMNYIFGNDPDSSENSSCGVPDAFTLKLGRWDYSAAGWQCTSFPMRMKDLSTGKVYSKGSAIPAVTNHTFVSCGDDENGETGGNGGNTPSTTQKTDIPQAAIVNVKTFDVNNNTYNITSVEEKSVSFSKAANKKSVNVPATVIINGTAYNVTEISAKAFTAKKIRTVTIGKNVKKINKNAFKGSKATKMIVKTKLLKKAAVKGSLKGSKVKTVQVKIGKKSLNKKYVKKYRKIFTKKIAGKKAAVK